MVEQVLEANLVVHNGFQTFQTLVVNFVPLSIAAIYQCCEKEQDPKYVTF